MDLVLAININIFLFEIGCLNNFLGVSQRPRLKCLNGSLSCSNDNTSRLSVAMWSLPSKLSRLFHRHCLQAHSIGQQCLHSHDESLTKPINSRFEVFVIFMVIVAVTVLQYLPLTLNLLVLNLSRIFHTRYISNKPNAVRWFSSS
jgi:hypothetical protein